MEMLDVQLPESRGVVSKSGLRYLPNHAIVAFKGSVVKEVAHRTGNNQTDEKQSKSQWSILA